MYYAPMEIILKDAIKSGILNKKKKISVTGVMKQCEEMDAQLIDHRWRGRNSECKPKQKICFNRMLSFCFGFTRNEHPFDHLGKQARIKRHKSCVRQKEWRWLKPTLQSVG